MSTRLRTGKLRSAILTASGVLAFVLLGAAPAAAHSAHEDASSDPDGFTPPYASVRITGDDVDNREFSVRITGDDADNREFSVRITKLRGLDNRDFSVRITQLPEPDNRDFSIAAATPAK